MKRMVMVIIALGMCAWAYAEKPVVRTVTNVIRGEVSAKAKNFIAVVYEKDAERGVEYEMPFQLDKDVQLQHKSSLEQLQPGDIVEIEFEDTQEEYRDRQPDGSFEKKSRIVGRRARRIRFIRPKASGLYSPER